MAEDPKVTVMDLVAKLEAGVREVQDGEAWRAYLAAQARFHQYSLGNTLLLVAQMPTATRVCGFQGWLRFGRHVKRGEHGLKILAPVTVRKAAEDATEADEPQTVTRFRIVTVFDVSQTEGDPLPQHPCQDLTTASERGAWLYARLREVAAGEGISVHVATHMLGTAHGAYIPGEHAIILAPGLSTDQKAKTLCHELGHALLHRGSNQPRQKEEAEAEGTAFVVAAWAGLDTSSYSFPYVADWAGQDDGPALVRQAGAAIQRTAAQIIAALDPAAEAGNARETA